MSGGNAELIPFEERLRTLVPAAPQPADLALSWEAGFVPWAIDYLIGTVCFRSPDRHNHTACEGFYNRLSEVGREAEFYCLEAPYCCSGEIRIVDKLTGQVTYLPCAYEGFEPLLTGKCPRCGNAIEPLVLQRRRWREKILVTIGSATAEHEAITKTVTVDLKFRVADHMREWGTVDYGGVDVYQERTNLARAIYSKLMEMGLDGTDANDAAGVAAFAPVAVPLLEATHYLMDDEWDQLTRNQQRRWVPRLRAVVRRAVEGMPLPPLAEPKEDVGERLQECDTALGGNTHEGIAPVSFVTMLNQDESRRLLLMEVSEEQLAQLMYRGGRQTRTWHLDEDGIGYLDALLNPEEEDG